MNRITFSFFAVLALALVTVIIGDPQGGSALVWTGYGIQANVLATSVAIGAHLVLAALIYRLFQGLRWSGIRRDAAVPAGPSVAALGVLRQADEAEVALIGLRGLTGRAAERGELGTARKLAQRGLAERPGTGWLEELLEDPIAPTPKA